jgi:fucose permease
VLLAAFLAWDLRVAEPMLNLGFFRDPRFSVSSLAVATAGFALMGSMFVLTLYLQVTKGYSALEAGAAMTPIAFGLVLGAGRSHALVSRIGAPRVVALGLLLMAACLLPTFAWTPGTASWAIALMFLVFAAGMGLVNAPGTNVVMESVPEERSGVASGINNIARQVGDAFGVAVIGSIVSSIYASRLDDADAMSSLTRSARDTADNSVAAAHAVGAGLPSAIGRGLVDAANTAFTPPTRHSRTPLRSVSQSPQASPS